MKVIFLDIDGVLNSMAYVNKMGPLFDLPENQMDPTLIARLNKLTDATGAKLVISSTWRLPFIKGHKLDMLKECMASYGITGEVIDMTGDKVFAINNRRGKEIQEWIDDHYKEVDRFVIVDDDSDMGKLRRFLVKTNFDDGLQDTHLDQMAKMLHAEDDWRPVVESTPEEMY